LFLLESRQRPDWRQYGNAELPWSQGEVAAVEGHDASRSTVHGGFQHHVIIDIRQ
jgi:hypothetical protein